MTVSYADLLTAAGFAASKHRDQRRKDVEATPYINHPLAVAQLLAKLGGVTDLVTLQAALLHDTIEDTDTTGDELEERFGQAVRRLVEEVTDDKSLSQEERKCLQILHAPELSPAAKLIKLADKACNLADVTPTAPVGWSIQRKRDYLDWAAKVAAKLTGSNAALEEHFDAVVAERRRTLGL